jgi:hypothetical protein
MNKSKQPQDHLDPKPTNADALELQKQLMEHEQQKQNEFVEKYNALCEEYGYTIVPQVTVQLQRRQ